MSSESRSRGANNPRTPRGTVGWLYDSSKHGTLCYQPGDKRPRAERREGARRAAKEMRAAMRAGRSS
jgi:hypothetical protein